MSDHRKSLDRDLDRYVRTLLSQREAYRSIPDQHARTYAQALDFALANLFACTDGTYGEDVYRLTREVSS